MQRSKALEKYVYDFFHNRFDDLSFFYEDTYANRRNGIYHLEEGAKLMDLLNDIHSNIESLYIYENLIPHKFPTPEALLSALVLFKEHLHAHKYLVEMNVKGEDTNDIVLRIQGIMNETADMIDYAKKVYNEDNAVVPYMDLRHKLIIKDIPGFIKILESVLASVSYAITKVQEGFYHSNVHLILKLLGFDILSEEITNNGRIDSIIRLFDVIYIIEFKFGKTKDLSVDALQQIKDKKYALKYLTEKKQIIGIGISFDIANRNINGFKEETLA